MVNSKLKLGVIISGKGSNLKSLIEATQKNNFPAEIVIVIANVPIFYDAAILLLPFAWLGHISGNRLHRYILSKDISSIQQTIGLALLVSALIGLIKIYL